MRLSIKNPLTAFVAVGLAALVLAACGNGNDDTGAATAANASASSAVVSVENVDGTDVLADSEGKTLYTADVEKGGQIVCTDGCTSIWEPAMATAKQAEAASSQLGVELATVNRPDGGRQLTFEGLPVYSFSEEGAGALDGNGFTDDFNGTRFVWTAATTDGSSGSSTMSTPSSSSPY